jgi:ankyrin repeat protein
MRRFFLMAYSILFIGIVSAQNKTDKDMEHSLLIRSAQNNDTIALKQLIGKGVDIEWKDERGRTALMAATYGNHIEAVEILVRAGADVNAQDNQLNSPFLYAGAEGFTQIVKICMAADPDYGIFNRYYGTALIPACERAHLEVIEILLADPTYPINHINRLGWTALLEAIILGHGDKPHQHTVSMLIAAGADVNIPDGNQISPLQHAQQKGYREIIRLLLDAGAK